LFPAGALRETEGSLKPIIERWKSLGIPITAGPAPRTGALGGMTSIYCEDPDGNLVEVATYSADP
jgi:catechol 2,3-dioxygenase-like lactoylglutathione lyase family enzyme